MIIYLFKKFYDHLLIYHYKFKKKLFAPFFGKQCSLERITVAQFLICTQLMSKFIKYNLLQLFWKKIIKMLFSVSIQIKSKF